MRSQIAIARHALAASPSTTTVPVLAQAPASRNRRIPSSAIGNGNLSHSAPFARGYSCGGIIARRRPFPTSKIRVLPIGIVRLQSTSSSSSSSPSAASDDTNAASASSSSSPPPRRSRAGRFLLTTFLFFLSTTAGFAMASVPAAETVNGTINPPTDAETLGLFKPETASARELNNKMLNLPLAIRLRGQPELTEARPHMKIAAGMRAHNLSAGVLMGEEKLEIPPLYFTEKNEGDADSLPTLTQITWIGPALCGHPGIVHGGLLATLLDEGLARCCFPALPNKVGVTANLKIDYRVPCTAGRFVVLKAQTTKVEGRKAWVKGWIEALNEDGSDGDGVKIVEAEALFVEPRQAKAMARIYTAN